MTNIPLDIERVVREVLAELKRAPGPEEPMTAAQTLMPGNRELVISTRLVTMEEISDRLDGIRQVVVGPQTVVTPAVRDALRQRNIELSRALSAKNTSAAPPRLVVVAARTKLDPKLLASSLRSEGIEVQCHKTDCILAATDRLAAELSKSDALGLLLTPHTAAALCLANRLTPVRAVLGSETNGLEADLSAVGANLLIVDPQSIGLFKLSRIAGEFFRGGIRPCPEVFKRRLT